MDPIFKSACRACLSRDEVRESSSSQEAPGHMYTLQDSAVRDLFMECTSISVPEPHLDSLPRQLCFHCYDKCEQWRSFKTMSLENNNNLQLLMNGGEGDALAIIEMAEEEEEYIEEDVLDEVIVPEGSPSPLEPDEETDYLDQLPNSDDQLSSLGMDPADSSNHVKQTHSGSTSLISVPTEGPLSKRATASGKVKKSDFYSCPLCDRVFLSAKSLKIHSDDHVGFKTCQVCGKTIKGKHGMTAHMKRHSEDRNFICKSCGKSFKTNGDLKLHERRHLEGPNNFECKICSRKFFSKGTLNYHMSTHPGVLPYKCKHCDSAYASASELKIHTREHSGTLEG